MPFGFPVPSNIPDRKPWVDVQTCKSVRKAPRPRNGKDRLRPTVLRWVTEAPEVGGVGLLRSGAQAPRANNTCPSPGKGHLAVFLHDIVVIILGQSSHQSEVPNLDQVTGSQKQVSSSQVTVNEALGLQVPHALSHLHSVATQRPQEEMTLVFT